MNYRALLFDFDGTLAATLPSWCLAYQRALSGYGVTLAEDEVVSRCFYTAYTEVARSFGIACPKTLEQQVNSHVNELIPGSPLYPFFENLVRGAKAQQLLVGLVTSSWRGVVEPFLHQRGLAPLFDSLTTCEDVSRLKPDPEPLFHALQTLGLAPEEALFVGDAKADILAGQAAGVDVALFFPQEHHAFYSLSQLRALQPRFTISCHSELFEIALNAGKSPLVSVQAAG